MNPQSRRSFAIAAVAAAGVAFTSPAFAGGYPGNACVGKKQAAVGKYTASVVKAWVKDADDATARDEAIAKAATKLGSTFTKEETKAVGKGATCNESTATATEIAAIVDASVAGVAADSTVEQLGDYMKAATKAWSKYLKDPVKDPGKLTLTAALAAASTEKLVGANAPVLLAADDLLSDVVDATTTAPNYPTSFQTIVPGSSVLYGKTELTPKCVDDDPYMYFAKRGNSNNVLMYYQGGGACWSGNSCFLPVGVPSICSRTADAGDNPALATTGFADYTDPSNPFYDWNVVFVTYCTCDVHWGSNRQDYEGVGIAKHYGRINAAVAEKFAREHFVDPERVFVTGSSAGSYGAIMNSYWLMKEVWPNADYSVLGDAGVGVITKQWLDQYINNWGVQENFPEDLGLASDDPRDLSLVDLIDGLSQKFPNARFANYDSSYDGGGGSQSNFFQVMRHPSPPFDNVLYEWQNYWETACEWNACMREFKAENASRSSNYHLFTGAGSRHTIFGSDKVFVETKSTDADGAGVTFASWVQAMIDDSPAWVDVDCNNPGGDCNLTNSCQGGANAGQLCSPKCSGGPSAGSNCANNGDCGGTCTGGDNNGLPCEAPADCQVDDPGIDGTCNATCSNASNPDCPGGSCQLDPDTTNAPYNNDDTVTCAPTTCPCGPASARCFAGINDGDPCDTTKPFGGDEDCKVNPTSVTEQGSCSYVNCSAP
jgi:hypothetical protein